MQLIFSTLLKGIIRKECQSFTNHGHDKTPPTVFNPLSLWLTLPRDMGVRHTQWPPSIARAILACLWFAQYDVHGDSMYSILSIDATYFLTLTKEEALTYSLIVNCETRWHPASLADVAMMWRGAAIFASETRWKMKIVSPQ